MNRIGPLQLVKTLLLGVMVLIGCMVLEQGCSKERATVTNAETEE